MWVEAKEYSWFELLKESRRKIVLNVIIYI